MKVYLIYDDTSKEYLDTRKAPYWTPDLQKATVWKSLYQVGLRVAETQGWADLYEKSKGRLVKCVEAEQIIKLKESTDHESA
jgi:hypothetical protein